MTKERSVHNKKDTSCFFILNNFCTYSIQYANECFLELLGEEHVSSLTDYLSVKEARDLVDVTRRENSRFSFTCTLVTRDNVYISAVLKFMNIADVIYCYVENYKEDDCYVKRLEFEYDRASALIELTGCMLAEFNSDGNLTYATSSLLSRFSFSKLENGIVNILTSGLVFRKDFKQATSFLRNDFSKQEIYCCELRLLTSDSYIWYKLTTKGILDSQGFVRRVILKLEDINEYKCMEKALKIKVNLDDLTHCYKKSFLLSELSNQVLTKGCLAFFDIDNFKGINDSFGHLAGDVALKEVANVCNLLFDAEDDIVCRFGGDEFCIFSGSSSRDSFEKKIQRLQNKICKIDIDGYTPVSISVGASVVSSSVSSIQSLLDVADSTLYIVKENGKNSYKFSN